MIGTSLSAVAAFAAFTLYTIVDDEIRANRGKKTSYTLPEKAPALPIRTQTASESALKEKAKTKTARKKVQINKAVAVDDPITLAADRIMEYVLANGPITLNKLSQVLKIDKDTVQQASEKLVANHSISAVKRGGYPALTPAQ